MNDAHDVRRLIFPIKAECLPLFLYQHPKEGRSSKLENKKIENTFKKSTIIYLRAKNRGELSGREYVVMRWENEAKRRGKYINDVGE